MLRTWVLERILKRSRPAAERYFVSIAAVATSLYLTMSLESLDLGHFHSLNLASTVLVTMYGGFGPGLLSGVLGAIGMDYFVIEPLYSIEFHNPVNVLRLVLYVAISFCISWLVDSLHRAYALAEKNRQLAEESRKAREELVSILAHDLRSPLGGIRLCAQAIGEISRKADSREKIGELSNSIAETITRMNRLIGDILDATKVEHGRLSLLPTSFEPRAIVNDVVTDFLPLANEKKVQITARSEDNDKTVFCDRDRVYQVLANFLSNAIKFSSEGGQVHVEARKTENYWRFGVSDNGPGIPDANLPRIFEKHWQSKEHIGQGTGLGLFISKGIVEAHGGTIWAESRPGEGTQFLFTIPATLPPTLATASL